MSKPDFEKLLLEAVDEGLSSLGDSSKRAIYFHLEKSFNIRREEIPGKIEVFAEAIEKVFGSGADFLEILIMKRLHEKVGTRFKLHETTDFAFADYMATVKRHFIKKAKVERRDEEVVRCETIEISS